MTLLGLPFALLNLALCFRTEHEQMLMGMAWAFETQTNPPVPLTRS